MLKSHDEGLCRKDAPWSQPVVLGQVTTLLSFLWQKCHRTPIRLLALPFPLAKGDENLPEVGF